MNMRLILLLMQLEIGISTKRYLPAIGTAGLLRVAVNGYKRVPAPPPNMTAMTFLLIMFNCIWSDKDRYNPEHFFPN
jgi:hypothetical protein